MKYFYCGALFFILAYLLPISSRPLLRPDEFRYGEIPREMLASGDFMIPRLLGVRYFEKPVLGYWLTAASFRLLGENRFALRLPMALAVGCTALLLGLWIRRERRDPELALFAALFFLSTGLAFALGTTAVLDGILCLFTTATILCARLAVCTERWNFERAAWLVLCGVTAGLGFMTKGLVAWAVPGLTVGVWLLWEKRFTVFLWLPWIPLAALAVTVFPWVRGAHCADADFWRYFIVVEHFQRFNEEVGSQHPEPFWYFIPVLLGTVFPAALAAFPGFAAGKTAWLRLPADPLWRFSLCGFLPSFIFFSASSGKLATYILPCYPFLSVLLAIPTLAALRGGRKGALTVQRWSFDLLGWLLLASGAGAVAFSALGLPPVRLSRFIPALGGTWFFFALLGVMGIAGGIVLLRLRESPRLRIVGFFTALALLGAGGAPLPDFASDKMPERDLLALKESGKFDPATILPFTYGSMGHSVAWSLNRPDTRLLIAPGEMEYGEARARAENEPPLVFSREEFAALLERSDRPDVVYFTRIKRDIYDPFKAYPHRRLVCRSMQALIFPPARRNSPPPVQ